LIRTRRHLIGIALAVVLLMPIVGSASADTVGPAIRPWGGTDHLYSGQILRAGEYLSSPNGMYELRVQPDGNLVIYRITSSVTPIWATMTNQYRDVWLGNQDDGNLVLYAPGPRPLWATGTNGRGPSALFMQNDGNLVLRATGNVPTWASNTWSSQRPAACDPAAPILLGANFSVPTPDYPRLDGGWLHSLGRVNSWSAPCGSWLQAIVERKDCGTFGCGWVQRAVSPKVNVNQRGWTFVEVHTTCKAGTHRYRSYTLAWFPQVSSSGSYGWKEARSPDLEYSC
jgi:hypothetical protein